MTTTLPERSVPPDAITRRHSPTAGVYADYRACLRWEFAFTCAFCVSHEADFTAHGAAGTGLMTIEHRVPRSDPVEGELRENEYTNCYYSCRFCNQARATRPLIDASGRHLLDPCADAWSGHFKRVRHEIVRRSDADVDAEYTSVAYDINDPRKIAIREERALVLRTVRSAVDEIPPKLANLSKIAKRVPEALAHMKRLRVHLKRAFRDLERYAFKPVDAPQKCRCEDPAACALPAHSSSYM